VIAWVLGASGTWGNAVALELLSRGYDVVALGRSDAPDLAQEASRLGRGWAFLPLDLAAEGGAASATLGQALGRQGTPAPDVFIVCAAVTGRDRETTTRANYLAPASLLERVAAAMAERGSGRIGVFVAQNARLGMAGLGDHSAAQAALWTWCEALQGELAAHRSSVTLTRVIPPRAASATQRWVAERSGRSARLREPRAAKIVSAVLAGKRRAGRRPTLAALSTLLR
jgi:short-subunit dehydrogenase